MCELCFVQHGKQTLESYDCALVLGRMVKLCKRCMIKNKTIITEYKRTNETNWHTMITVSTDGVVL